MHRRAVAHWRRQQRACAQTRSLRLPLARLPRAAPCRPFRPSPQARRSKRACLTSITPRACAGAARAAGATREAPARAFARNQHLGSLAHISAFGCRVWAPPSGSVWSEVDAWPSRRRGSLPTRRPSAAPRGGAAKFVRVNFTSLHFTCVRGALARARPVAERGARVRHRGQAVARAVGVLPRAAVQGALGRHRGRRRRARRSEE